ncbi:MAG: extracellular solute-binding protein [Bauldia sp.]
MSRRAGLSRREALKLGGAAAAIAAMRPFAWAAGRSGLHGLSVFGELKYPPDFKHFDYVNPLAPKGGRFNFQPPNWLYNQATQTFNTLNSFVRRGDSPPRMELTFDTLMAAADDEPDSVYGLLAESVAVSDDGNTYTFTLRDGPRFHDGTPLTADDVAFSLMLLKEKGHPNISQVIAEMAKAEAPDARTVVVTLSGKQNRYTILTIAGLPVFSRTYFATREFDAATLAPIPGSGPYRVGPMSAGRFIEFTRDPAYWGKDLSVNAGINNFDVIRIDFFKERQTAFEAFKKGDLTYREEFTSKTWATEYKFPTLIAGKVKQTLIPEEKRPSFQGSFFNVRKAKLADSRTRLAIALAFDFEWTNRNLFYGAYTRLTSYFGRSDFAAAGLPDADEIALLDPFRGDLPAEVFGEPYSPPVSDGSGRDRTLLRRAATLLADAGWRARGNGLVNDKGETLEVEFLIDAEVFEKVLSAYAENLKRIGVGVTIRQVDPAQYQLRSSEFDFDVLMVAQSMAATPLDGLQQLFGSKAADTPGSFNYAGIKDKTIDALLDRLPKVASRAELTALTRAMDRVLRASHYWVPNWTNANHRVAHWDLFAWSGVKPDYAFRPETNWWYDSGRATAIGMAG